MTAFATAHGQDGSIAIFLRDGNGRLVEFMLLSYPLWPDLGHDGWRPPPLVMPARRRPPSGVVVRPIGLIRRAR